MSTIISGFAVVQIEYRFLNNPSGPEIRAKRNITRTRKSRPFHNLRGIEVCVFRYAYMPRIRVSYATRSIASM